MFLTPDVWDAWHTAIKTGDGALYIGEGRTDGDIWRVKLNGIAVFVVMRAEVIRTALPNYGWHIEQARIAAEAIGETSLGLKLPAKRCPKPDLPLTALGLNIHFQETQIALEKAAAKRERIRVSEERNKTQALLFVKTVRTLVSKDDFGEMWRLTREMFPDDAVWDDPVAAVPLQRALECENAD